jgi:hypothetical protein
MCVISLVQSAWDDAGDYKLMAFRVAVSVLTILKQPMILMGLVSMAIFFGMPYLVDNSMFSPTIQIEKVADRHYSGPRDEG